jgi:LysM repeat protein
MKVRFSTAAALALMTATVSLAQSRDDFMRQQAYAEMQRVLGQIEVLQQNIDDISRRLAKLESKGAADSVEVEISALKGSIAELRREMGAQRGEIVKDLSGRIAKIASSSPQAAPRQQEVQRKITPGAHLEYVVQSGDSLFLISKAFNVSVRQIKELNGLKSDNLKIGQKIYVPKTKD